MSRLLTCLIVLLCYSTSQAESWSAEMVDFGVYDTVRGPALDHADSAGGLQLIIAKILKEQTTNIPGKLGVSFGFRYKLKGPAAKARVTLKMTHPNPLKDPATGREFAVSEWSQSVPVNQVNWNSGWLFSEAWEIVPGQWNLQLYAEEQLLLEKTFTVL